MRRLFIFALFVSMVPMLSLAESTTGVDGLLTKIAGWIGAIGKIMIAATVVAFFYGLFLFVVSEGTNKDKGKSIMGWGIVALFVMVSIWGIVNFLQTSLGVTGGTKADPTTLIPDIK